MAKKKTPDNSQICKRKCFKCEKPLRGAFCGTLKQPFDEAPSDATVWTTRGNWGSGVLDQAPYDPETFEISICDECFVAHRNMMLISIVKQTRTVRLVKETHQEELQRTLGGDRR